MPVEPVALAAAAVGDDALLIDGIAARLGVPVEDVDRVHRLAGDRPSVPLLEYLPADSNIVRFQRRFQLEPYEEPEGLDADVEVLRFAFRTLTTPLDQLPCRTVLPRAIVDHLRAGRHWYWRRGHFPV
jgi:hypothetical protein